MQCYRPVQPVKAMTFDLDDTLYDNGPVIASATASLNDDIARLYPATAALPATQWTTIKRDLIKANPGLASDMGRLRYESLYAALAVEKLADEQRKAAAQSLFDAFYDARSNFSVDNGIKQVLATLAEKMPLIAITNGNVDTVKTGLSEYFTASLHASVGRPSKPHRHMFDEAVAMLKLPPENVLHVGDNLEKDILGAHRAGLQSAWYAANRPMNLQREPVSVLPTVQLANLHELTWFI
ncbi:HAD-IA family hydrolase [Alteromonas gilva]|uniref:HAD-IA family hydrolase n=1 Tax=Alteromonas gilva TaxID=2987522 RepID=A0ABT5KZH6_9ALTE|nr:HAD-IA family hydrolase [Alteromonas gilva]MDC8829611.1 HAD-IA family hydrolase [Alteromonas gilva]